MLELAHAGFTDAKLLSKSRPRDVVLLSVVSNDTRNSQRGTPESSSNTILDRHW